MPIKLTVPPPDVVARELNTCGKRFLFFPLELRDEDDAGHANVVIIDRQEWTLERFDSHGKFDPKYDGYNTASLDRLLQQHVTNCARLATGNDALVLRMITPRNMNACTLQTPDTDRSLLGDALDAAPGGFCQVWSTWYIDMRLQHVDISTEELHRLIESIVHNHPLYRERMNVFIRRYAQLMSHVIPQLLREAANILDTQFFGAALRLRRMAQVYDQLERVASVAELKHLLAQREYLENQLVGIADIVQETLVSLI